MGPFGAAAAQSTWKPLVLCPHRDLSNRIRLAFTELGIGKVNLVSEYPRMGSLATLAAQNESNLCLLDVASNPDHALLLISEAAAAMSVVALNTRKDADLILRCLRQGASEFLAEPTGDQLRSVLDRLQRLRAPGSPGQIRPSVVYCLVPGKPGCGASTLAAHLAVDIHHCGAARVLLVDTDLLTGTLSFLLKLKPDFHLGDAVRDRQRMDADLWGRLAVACHGIDVLPAPENPAALVELNRAVALELLAFWRTHYDAIVLDTAGAQAGAVEFARLADEILLVTTNELVALHATRRSIEFLEQNGVARPRLRLIVNRYTPANGLRPDEVQSALKLEPYALLANEYAIVQEAVLEGRPVIAGSRLGRGIQALAARLMGKPEPEKRRLGWLLLRPAGK